MYQAWKTLVWPHHSTKKEYLGP